MSAAARPYERLLELGFSFAAAQALFAAIELDVFSTLAAGPLSGADLARRVGAHPRAADGFFETLVALGLLARVDGSYVNTRAAAEYLDKGARSYIGDWFVLGAVRLYRTWGCLPEALRTGCPQNEAKIEADYYANLWASPERHAAFLRGMDALTLKAATVIARRFPWTRYGTFADIGGARGALAAAIATAHPHLRGDTFDLPQVRPYFDELVGCRRLQERLTFRAGDFFADALPPADVLIMGHVLHNWSLEQKQLLARKAFDALPRDGALVVYEWFLDGSSRLLGRLMDLNMLLVTPQGRSLTRGDCAQLLRQAGFARVTCTRMEGPCSLLIGWKSRVRRARLTSSPASATARVG